ncbi:universal stress protein [Natrialbaceae archaeon A-CW3]
MYDRILLPTDGSETTSRALEHAADLAIRYDAELHILYVIDKAVFAGDIETGPIVDQFEAVGDSVLEDVATEAARAGVDPIVTHLGRGSPHSEILEYATDQDVDLIVMGTRGRTGLDRYLIGSVTEKVVRLSDVPVLTVQREGDAGDAADVPEGTE